jgi:hypothetical protein
MNRSVSSALSALALTLLAAACGTTDAAPLQTPSPAKPSSATPAEAQAGCVQVFTRNRVCTAQYIPALVDARAKHDKPAGIAARVQANRDEVIAKAMTEWEVDSTDEAIATTCQRIVENLTDEQRADAAPVSACLAQEDCAAYTSCVMPFFEKRFAN